MSASPSPTPAEEPRLSDVPLEDLTRAKEQPAGSPPANARGPRSPSPSAAAHTPVVAAAATTETAVVTAPKSPRMNVLPALTAARTTLASAPEAAPAVPVVPAAVAAAPTTRIGAPEQPLQAVSQSVVTEDADADEEPSILPFVYLPASKVYVSMQYQCFGFVILFLITMFGLCMVLTVTTWRYPDPTTQLQLPDIALDILPRVPELEHVTDLLLAMLEGMCFLTVGCMYLVKTGRIEAADKRRLASFAPLDRLHFVPWIRFFVCFTAITALRIIVVGATVLPATDNHCKTRPETGNFWWNSLVGVLSFGGSNVHCGDLLFSGHTAVITLSVAAVWDYGPIVSKWFRPISGVLMVCTWFTILMSRSHYTDDIVVAFYFAVTLWLLTPHDSIHGAPALWQLMIQNPCKIYALVQEATAERDARRAARTRGAAAV